jgi:hypothetical protein
VALAGHTAVHRVAAKAVMSRGNRSTNRRHDAVRKDGLKAHSHLVQKSANRAAKSAFANAYLYRGLFPRVRVVPALRALWYRC